MRKWANKAARIIVEHYDPDSILLFGSYAKGQQTAHSDIDLLIVKDTDLPRSLRGIELKDYLSQYPVKFDLLFYTHSELAQAQKVPYSFAQTIQSTGTLLYVKDCTQNAWWVDLLLDLEDNLITSWSYLVWGIKGLAGNKW